MRIGVVLLSWLVSGLAAEAIPAAPNCQSALAAAAAGLRPGDRIVALNGRTVQRAGEVIRGVRLHPDADPLVLTIERNGQQLQLTLRLPPASDPRLAARDNGANT
jgi:S1-C subfamily serine protease